MTMQKQYINSYSLSCMLKNQQNVPHKYDTKDYFGGCSRCIEENSADFLQNFIDGNIIVKPEDYELLGSLLFVLRNSGYSPIKKLLKTARKQYDEMVKIQHERIAMAKRVKPTNLNTPGAAKFSILDNKKKMLMMSYPDICALGDALNQEHEFNTTKIKNKFASFVSYRIDLVLMGKMPIDADFPKFLQKYGTQRQINLYTNIISNKTVLRSAKPQSAPSKAKKTIKPVKPVKQIAKKQPKATKSGPGFFKKLGDKISNTAKSVFNAVKKPALIIGILGAAVFGGKKIIDTAEQENAQPQFTQEYFQSNVSNSTYQSDTTKTLNFEQYANRMAEKNTEKAGENIEKTDTEKSKVLQKSIRRLQRLKETNPTDKNMDVVATANKLYEQFGHDAYKVILTGIMAPYALNDHTNFDIRPTTHNMIEYLCNNDLTAKQRAELDVFVAQHIAQMNYARQNQR